MCIINRKSVFVLLLTISGTLSVVRDNFKTCEQSSFCRRLRATKPDPNRHSVDIDTYVITENSIEIVNHEDKSRYRLTVSALENNIFRVFIEEKEPLHPRYEVKGVLKERPKWSGSEVSEKLVDKLVIKDGDNKAVIHPKPFKIEFFRKDDLVAVVNARGLFKMERLRKKPAEGEDNEDPGAWEENFKSHHDSKPRGPEAVGIDITFPGALRVYGLPEHADSFALRTTGPGGLDPYRLYNLDVFEYETDSTMALYGSVPVAYAHSSDSTVGVFWHNAAETWVDVTNSKDGNVVSSIVNLVSGNKPENNVDLHFMSESGVLDMFILMGPTPKDAMQQYTSLTGVAPLPPYFSLAYHQCRWNYNDEDDVINVLDNMDKHDFPVDVMWLDIEYTDGKKYFTWDPIKFAHPDDMVKNLTATGRKLVVIIDPHVKRENGYFLHEDALANDYYVKTKDGNVYEGWCWPGSSSYPDFFDPKVIDYYKSLYSFDKFKGTTKDVHIWNDMNEPSVFNGPEITMPKDCLHYGGWEHRHLHNIYGMAYIKVTYEGLVERSPNTRPFILTRSHFAGSQRYASVWTGDNTADWSHLKISYPMCLSEAISGISFCGADIGGFFNNPDIELLQRWYQMAIFLPFYRAHAHIDTRRREPYLFDEDVKNRIRNSIKLRYSLLPLWYTLFREHEINGEPVIRPLFYHYNNDLNVIDIDNQLLVGDYILAKPVQEQGATSVNVYLPGGPNEYWYDIEDFKRYEGVGVVTVPVTMDKIPAFYRGGTIIPRKDRPRRASTLTHNDPYTLYVALDNDNKASGNLYIDDGQSFDYRNNNYLYLNFQYKNNTIFSSFIGKTDYPTTAWIERIVVIGAPLNLSTAKLRSKSLGNIDLEISYDKENRFLVIRKPGVSVRERFIIKLQ